MMNIDSLFSVYRRRIALAALVIIGLLPHLPALAQQKELVIGVFPRRDAAITIRLFNPLANHLEKILGVKVRLETASNFAAFQRNIETRRYDLVHFNQYQYIKAHEKQRYDVLVQNEEFGEKTIKGAIYVRKDSGIGRIGQLKGKTILFGGGKDAMMSYLVPTYLLRRAGLRQGDYKEAFAVSPPNAVLSTHLGQADAGGAGEVVRRLPLVMEKIDTEELALLAVSEPLPHLPWAVKQEIPEIMKRRIKEALLALKESADGRKILKRARLSGFNAANDETYDAHRKIIRFLED